MKCPFLQAESSSVFFQPGVIRLGTERPNIMEGGIIDDCLFVQNEVADWRD